jgi:tRNA (guanine-N7-)-methyltransferase
MARTKLAKFKEIEGMKNVVEPTRKNYFEMKGAWADFFGNSNPIFLELACGYGEYTTGLAQRFPDTNFIGVDIKGERIWQAAKNSDEKLLTNTVFLRAEIQDLQKFFNKGEASEIWIIHPDPFPKESDAKKRLTHPKFLSIFAKILKPIGIIHIKTDDTNLYTYSLQEIKKLKPALLESTEDLHSSPLQENHFGITTRFEKKAINVGRKIKYIKFQP